MARQPEIQYIRLYTDGSAARSLELNPQRRQARTRLPKVNKEKPLVIAVDVVSICSLIVVAVMLVTLAMGCVQLGQAQKQTEQMASYVSSLRNENAELQYAYESGCDLEYVKKTALALGMVPKDQVTMIHVQTMEPQVEIQFYEPTFWEWFSSFFAGLFA